MARSGDDWDELTERTRQRKQTRKRETDANALLKNKQIMTTMRNIAQSSCLSWPRRIASTIG